MTHELVALALRAVAAGAPVPRKIAVMGGPRSVRCRDSGLLYGFGEVSRNGALPLPMALPILSDPSWLGWVLEEVERRGCSVVWRTWAKPGEYMAQAWPRNDGNADGVRFVGDRPSALVAMLEATK